MGLLNLLHDARFDMFFSVIVGIGLICIIRPMCTGSACNVDKAPMEKDFDKYVYRMREGKCYEFKTVIKECPASGAVEAFREYSNSSQYTHNDQFTRRTTRLS